jgi:hypothetical protein
VFASNITIGNTSISIFAPELGFSGHSITNLARFQTVHFQDRASSLARYSNFRESDRNRISKQVNFFHIGNSWHNLEVLKQLLNSQASKNIVVLHDTNLTDLIRYYINREGLGSLRKVLKNTSPQLLRRILIEDEKLGKSEKLTFFANALRNSEFRNSEFVVHNSVLKNQLHRDHVYNLRKIELPVGYHFLRPLPRPQFNKKPIIAIGGSHIDESFASFIGEVIYLLSKRKLRFVFCGGIAQKPLGQLKGLPNVSILANMKDENWKLLLRRSRVAVRLNVGGNGESSGFLRDALVCSNYVIGDENSDTLTQFKHYRLLPQKMVPTALSDTISELVESNVNSVDNNSELLQKENVSLNRYFWELSSIGSSE